MSSEELQSIPMVAFQTIWENTTSSVCWLGIDDVILRCPFCNCGWMKSHLIQPDIDYCGVCMESKLILALCCFRRECGSGCMGWKIFWRQMARLRARTYGFKTSWTRCFRKRRSLRFFNIYIDFKWNGIILLFQNLVIKNFSY